MCIEIGINFLLMILLSFDRIRSKLTSHQETGKLHKWLELLNFDSDFIRGGGENSDYEHFLDLAKHSEYKFSERHENDDGEESKSETAMQHDLDDLDSHKNKPDWLVLDSEKFLASKSAECGVFDKNLGKIHRMYIHVLTFLILFKKKILILVICQIDALYYNVLAR